MEKINQVKEKIKEKIDYMRQEPEKVHVGYEQDENPESIESTQKDIEQQKKEAKPPDVVHPIKKMFIYPKYNVLVNIYTKNNFAGYTLARNMGKGTYKTLEGEIIDDVRQEHFWKVKSGTNRMLELTVWETQQGLIPFTFEDQKGEIKKAQMSKLYLKTYVEKAKEKIQRWTPRNDSSRVVSMALLIITIGAVCFVLWQALVANQEALIEQRKAVGTLAQAVKDFAFYATNNGTTSIIPP